MEILLIRHGDPDYANDCLTAVGRHEAQCLAAALDGMDLDALYVSPRGRARETCAHTADRKGIRPTVLDWLEEKNITRRDACLWEAPGSAFLRVAGDGRRDWFDLDAVLPEGREQFALVARGFDALLAEHGYERTGDLYRAADGPDRRIALFCHKGVILTLLSGILRWPLPMIFIGLEIQPTGVTRLVTVRQNSLVSFKAVAINDRSHLRGTA